MATSSTGMYLVEEGRQTESVEGEEENQSVQTEKCLVNSSEPENLKKRPQVVKPGSDVPKWFSQRWIFCYVSFIGMMFVLSVRMGMSVAIVCMVKKKIPLENNSLTIDSSCISAIENLDNSEVGEFEWNDFLVANILAGFYYGYMFTNFLGGILADKFGGRRVFGYCLLTSAILLLFYPVLSRVSGYWTLSLRVISGLLSGPFFPAIHSLWGRWAPPCERGKLVAISYSGPLIGTIITMSVSGYLCDKGFDNGWGSIFYLTGIFAFLYSIFWFYVVYESPQQHPRITAKELDFLENTIRCQARVKHIPWKSILTSKAVWAIIICHFCNNWSLFTLHTMLPLFMKEVLYFDTKTNGFMSSVPYVGIIITYSFVGTLADFIIRRGYLTVRATRVFMQSISFIGSAVFFVAIGFINCSNAVVAVWFLFFAGAFMGFNAGGFIVNHIDIAPSYAGLLFGVTNTVSAVPGFLAPILAGALTHNGTQEEWQKVFIVCASFACLGAIVFAIFSKGEVQKWENCLHKDANDRQNDDNTFSKI